MYTDIPAMPHLHQDLKKDCNLLALQMFLTDLVCGVGAGIPSMSPEANTADLGGGNYHKSLPKWMAGEGDAGQVRCMQYFKLVQIIQPLAMLNFHLRLSLSRIYKQVIIIITIIHIL